MTISRIWDSVFPRRSSSSNRPVGTSSVTGEHGAGSTFSIRVQLEIDEGEGETSVTDALKGKNVLVVEDNQINREILCEYLHGRRERCSRERWSGCL